MRTKPAMVVLAAGKGSRFRGPDHKLSQPWGTSDVLGETLRRALATGLHVVVVTTERLAAQARLHVAARDIVVLPEVGTTNAMPLGMGYSIAAGVAALPDAAGWLVMPGDMPLVSSATMLAVARALEDYPVAYATHQGRRGHPVGFGAELYTELATLSGDEGAKRLIARFPSQAVETGDKGVLLDIDTQADLEAARGHHVSG